MFDRLANGNVPPKRVPGGRTPTSRPPSRSPSITCRFSLSLAPWFPRGKGGGSQLAIFDGIRLAAQGGAAEAARIRPGSEAHAVIVSDKGLNAMLTLEMPQRLSPAFVGENLRTKGPTNYC